MKKVVYVSPADLKSEEATDKAIDRISDGLVDYFDIGCFRSLEIKVEFSALDLVRVGVNDIFGLVGLAIIPTALERDFRVAISTDIKQRSNGSVLITLTIVDPLLYSQPINAIGVNLKIDQTIQRK